MYVNPSCGGVLNGALISRKLAFAYDLKLSTISGTLSLALMNGASL